MLDIIEDKRTSPVNNPVNTDDGDHDKFAHYASKEAISEAIFNGVPCIALCGKKWIPNVGLNAEKYPVCPECEERYKKLSED